MCGTGLAISFHALVTASASSTIFVPAFQVGLLRWECHDPVAVAFLSQRGSQDHLGSGSGLRA